MTSKLVIVLAVAVVMQVVAASPLISSIFQDVEDLVTKIAEDTEDIVSDVINGGSNTSGGNSTSAGTSSNGTDSTSGTSSNNATADSQTSSNSTSSSVNTTSDVEKRSWGINYLIDWINNGVDNAVNTAKKIADDIFGDVKEFNNEMSQKVKNALSTTATHLGLIQSVLESAFSDVSSKLLDLGTTALSKLQEAITAVANIQVASIETAEKALQDAATAFESLVAESSKVESAMVKGIVASIQQSLNSTQALFNSVKSKLNNGSS